MKLGLNAQELFMIGMEKYQEAYAEAYDFDLHCKTLELFGNNDAAKDFQSKEALLRAVAKMIQENNDVLLNELKQLGVFRNQGLS